MYEAFLSLSLIRIQMITFRVLDNIGCSPHAKNINDFFKDQPPLPDKVTSTGSREQGSFDISSLTVLRLSEV